MNLCLTRDDLPEEVPVKICTSMSKNSPEGVPIINHIHDSNCVKKTKEMF